MRPGGALPDSLGAPATRALIAAGLESAGDAGDWRESDLSDLHGVGPRAIATLRAELAKQGLAFRHQDDGDEAMVAVLAYRDAQPQPQRATLTALRDQLCQILPLAEEGISYGLPALLLQGIAVAGYGATATHCIFVPMSGTVLTTVADHLGDRPVSKGVLQFGIDEQLPAGLLRRMVKARLTEVSAVSDGYRREYFPDGRVKAEGSMVRGELHGPWFWYRADGSLMRTGEFRNGQKTGQWDTWERMT